MLFVFVVFCFLFVVILCCLLLVWVVCVLFCCLLLVVLSWLWWVLLAVCNETMDLELHAQRLNCFESAPAHNYHDMTATTVRTEHVEHAKHTNYNRADLQKKSQKFSAGCHKPLPASNLEQLFVSLFAEMFDVSWVLAPARTQHHRTAAINQTTRRSEHRSNISQQRYTITQPKLPSLKRHAENKKLLQVQLISVCVCVFESVLRVLFLAVVPSSMLLW